MAKTQFPFFLKSSHKIRLGSKINSPCIASRWRSIQNNFPNLKGEYEKQKLQDWCDTSDCVGWIKTKVLSATDRKGWWAHWRWDQVMRDLQAGRWVSGKCGKVAEGWSSLGLQIYKVHKISFSFWTKKSHTE